MLCLIVSYIQRGRKNAGKRLRRNDEEDETLRGGGGGGPRGRKKKRTECGAWKKP